MKAMSLQQALDFLVYLNDQEKLKTQAYFNTPLESPYKDEVRCEAEAYQEIAKAFAGNFKRSISSPQDIPHGLTAQQATGFLDYLEEKIIKLKAALEQTQRNRQEALATVQDFDYPRVKNIYKQMENLKEDQMIVFENSRKNFMRILFA